jgi:uncharacterized protein YfaS (alpha-2-macroglobulin family)/tetratricopeptide (TPR) repeat protein/type II secretory pathway component GspD/PulD (secretin)
MARPAARFVVVLSVLAASVWGISMAAEAINTEAAKTEAVKPNPDGPLAPEKVRQAMQDANYAEAVKAIDEAAAAKDAPKDYLAYLKARAYELNKQYDQAVAAYEQVEKDFPKSEWARQARFGKALALARAGDFRAAELIFRAEAEYLLSADRKQQMADIYLEFADKYFKPAKDDEKPNYQKALDFYQKALEAGPKPEKRIEVELLVAQCNQLSGKVADAAAQYEKFIKDHAEAPLDFEARLRMGFIPLWPARSAQGEARELEARFRLGECRFAQGDLKTARRVWQDLLALFPDSQSERIAEAQYNLAKTWRVPQPTSDEELNLGTAALDSFIERFPSHKLAGKAFLDSANSFISRGRYEDSTAALKRFLAADRYKDRDEVPEARYLLALSYQLQKRFAESLAAWQDYLVKHPTHRQWSKAQQEIVNTEYLMAADKLQSKDYEGANKLFAGFLAKYPLDTRNPAIMMLVNTKAQEERNWDEAIAGWRRVASKYPGSNEASQAQYMIAETLEKKLGKLEEAIEEYRKVASGPAQADAQRAAARLTAKTMTVATERVFRSDEKPRLKLITRNIESVTVRTYKVDLETYFRKMHLARGVESLDVALIDPDKTFEFQVPNYAKHQELESFVEVPLGGDATAGAMVVAVSSKMLEATTLVLQSDLDVIVKSSRDEVFVFAENMLTGKPWPQAKILLSNGKEVFAEETTGRDGVLQKSFKELKDAGDVRVFAVAGGNAASNIVALQGVGVSSGLTDKGYVYTDRPAYRAGQLVNVRGCLRRAVDDAYTVEKDKTFTLEVFDSRNRLLRQEPVKLDEFGAFHANFILPEPCPEGQYRMSVHDESLKQTYQGGFQVHQLRIDPVYLAIDLPRAVYYRGEQIEGTIRAAFYYGAPLAGREIRYQLAGGQQIAATTDEKGEVKFKLPTREFNETQVLPLVAVMPDRNLQTTTNVVLSVQGFSLGLSTVRPVYVSGETFEVKLSANDAEGKPTAQKVNLKVLEQTAVDGKVGERLVAEYGLETAADTGLARRTLKLQKGGTYILRAEGIDRFKNPVTGQNFVQISDEEDDVRLRVLSDLHTFKVGDTGKVAIHWREEPALALITFQGAKVLDYKLVELKTGANEFEIPMTAKLAPNFELSVAVMTDGREKTADAETVKKAAQDGQKSKPIPKNEKGELCFNFVNTPWKEVIIWFVEEADFSLVTNNLYPPGVFNYIDPKWYSPEQALDIINGALLYNGYILVLHDKLTLVLPLSDSTFDLLPILKPEDLDGKSKFEMLRVQFDLDSLDQKEVEQQVMLLLGPQAKVNILPNANWMIVTAVSQNLKRLRDIIEQQRNPTKYSEREKIVFKVYDVEKAISQHTLKVLRELMTGQPDVRIDIDTVSGSIIAIGHLDDQAIIKLNIYRISKEATSAEPSPAQSPHPNPLVAREWTGKDEQNPKPDAVSKTDGKSAQAGPQVKPLPKNEKGELRFNFVNTPWKEVIEWFVEEADFSLVTNNLYPPGVLNYVDPTWYAPEKALDIINGILINNGYALIRRDKAIWIVDLTEIPQGMPRSVKPEALPENTNFEMMQVTFDLGQLAPSEVESELRKTIGPYGKIDFLPNAKKMLVTDISQNLRKMRDSIDRLRNPDKNVRTFELKHITTSEAIAALCPFFDLKEPEMGAADGSIRLVIDPTGKKLITSGSDEKKARVEWILSIIDVPRDGPDVRADLPGVVVYSTDGADPQQVFNYLRALYAGKPDARLDIDQPTGYIIVLAHLSEQKSIAAFLDDIIQIEKKRIVKEVPLNGLDAKLAIAVIQALFSLPGKTPEENAPFAPQVQSDPTESKLVIRASDTQLKQIDELIDQMRETPSTNKSKEDRDTEKTKKDDQGRKSDVVPKTDEKSAQAGPQNKPLPKNEKGELCFNFVNTPWKEVIEWFVVQSDYKLVSNNIFPSGVLNYVDPKWYSPENALDVLMGLIMNSGYGLVSRDKAIWVVDMADFSSDWALLHPEYLDGKGDFEMLGVKFDLGQLAPSEVEPEVRKLLGPQGKIDIFPKSKQMKVTDIVQNLRLIRDLIVRLRNLDKKNYRLFELKNITPGEAIAALRPFLGLKESEIAAADASIRLQIAPGGNKLIASGVPEKIARVEKILPIIDLPRGGFEYDSKVMPGVVVDSTDGAEPPKDAQGPHPNPLPKGEGTVVDSLAKGEGTKESNLLPKGEGTKKKPVVRFHLASSSFTVERDLRVKIETKRKGDAKGPVRPGDEVEVAISTTDAQGKPVAAELSLAMVEKSLLSRFPWRDGIGGAFRDAPRQSAVRTASSITFDYHPSTQQINSRLLAERERLELIRAEEESRQLAQKLVSPIRVTPGPNGLAISSDDSDALVLFQQMMSSVPVPPMSQPQVTIFYLKNSDAANVARTLNGVLSGSSVGGNGAMIDLALLQSLLGQNVRSGDVATTSAINITPYANLNALIVQGTETDVATVEKLVQILDRKEFAAGSAGSTSKIVQLNNTDPDDIVNTVQTVYYDHLNFGMGMGGPVASGGGRGGMAAPGGSRGGAAGSMGVAQSNVQTFSITADQRTKSVVVAANEPLLAEITRFVEGLDAQGKQDTKTLEIIRLNSISPDLAKDVLKNLNADQVLGRVSIDTVEGVNILLVHGDSKDVNRTKQLVTKMDTFAGKDGGKNVGATETTQLVQLSSLGPEAIQKALNALVGDNITYNGSSDKVRVLSQFKGADSVAALRQIQAYWSQMSDVPLQIVNPSGNVSSISLAANTTGGAAGLSAAIGALGAELNKSGATLLLSREPLETAYWNPAIVTDKDGKAAVAFTVPERSTAWSLLARGITADTLAGEAADSLAVKKDLFGQLKLPGSFTDGDEPVVQAAIHNDLIDKGQIEVTLKYTIAGRAVEEKKTLDVAAKGILEVAFADIKIRVPEAAEDKKADDKKADGKITGDVSSDATESNVLFELTIATGDRQDVVRQIVPLQPYGMNVYSAKSGSASSDTTDWVEPIKGASVRRPSMEILIGPTVEQSLMDVVFGSAPPCQLESMRMTTGLDSATSDLMAALALQKLLALSQPLFEGLGATASLPSSAGNTVGQANRGAHQSTIDGALDTTRESAGPQAQALDARIRSSVSLLVSSQRDDGGWSWAGSRTSGVRYCSARVLWAIGLAKKAGYSLPDATYTKAVDYLKNQLVAVPESDYESKAILLHALATAGSGDFALANRLYRNRPELSPGALAYLALAMIEMDRKPTAAELLDVLEKRDLDDAAATRLSPLANLSWSNAPAELHALAALALEEVSPNSDRAQKQVEWLMAHRTGNRWSPDKATGPAALAACRWYAENRFQGERYKLTVSVNDVQVAALDIDQNSGPMRVVVPGKLIKKDERQRINFQITGRGRYAYQCILGGFVLADKLADTSTDWKIERTYQPAPLELDGKEVPRGFGVLQGKYDAFTNPLTQLPVGRRGMVELNLTRTNVPLGASEQQLEYLVVTEPIPSGAAVLEQSVLGGFEWFEIGPGRITFYVGTQTNPAPIRYEIHGYLPGKYVAAPTVARNAHRPEQLAAAMAKTLEVLEQGRQSGDAYKLTPQELYELGKHDFQKNDMKRAIEHLTELVSNPRWILASAAYKDAARMLLDAHLAVGPAAKIVRWFEVVKENWPTEEIAFDKIVKVGAAYHEMGEYERSYLVFRATVESNFPRESRVAGFLEGQGEFDRAVAVMDRLLGEYPPESYIAASAYALAQRVYAKAPEAAADPGLRKLKLNRVDLTRRAWGMFESFLTAYPDDPAADQAAFAAVNALLDMRAYKQAAAACELYAKRYPKSNLLDSFWYVIGYCRFASGEHKDALEMCQRVADALRTDAKTGRQVESVNKWQAIYILGQIHHSMGEAAEAVREYARVQDRFPDAKESIEYFNRKSMELPEVTAVRPGAPAEVDLKFRNVAACDAKVYRIDLMKFSLLKRNLSGIVNINLSGIQPYHESSIALGDGKDYRDREHKLTLPLKEEGAYLVVCRGDDLYTSGLVLVSPMKIEVEEDAASGRVRTTVKDVVADKYLIDAQVKVIGSGNNDFISGETDLRGVFVADGIRGTSTVIAQTGSSRYAFFRGRTNLGGNTGAVTSQERSGFVGASSSAGSATGQIIQPPFTQGLNNVNVQSVEGFDVLILRGQAPNQQGNLEDKLLENVKGSKSAQQQQSMQQLDKMYRGEQKGVEVQKAF